MNIKDFKMNNLKLLREKNNMTQTKLSVDIEVSQELISHFEIGQSKPNIENLIKLADYFNCSTDYLLERTNIPTFITSFNEKDAETADILYKYNSLSTENKKHLQCFLDFLHNKK